MVSVWQCRNIGLNFGSYERLKQKRLIRDRIQAVLWWHTVWFRMNGNVDSCPVVLAFPINNNQFFLRSPWGCKCMRCLAQVWSSAKHKHQHASFSLASDMYSLCHCKGLMSHFLCVFQQRAIQTAFTAKKTLKRYVNNSSQIFPVEKKKLTLCPGRFEQRGGHPRLRRCFRDYIHATSLWTQTIALRHIYDSFTPKFTSRGGLYYSDASFS